ncbi:avenacinase [Kwoniella heveanensis BCC8398]|uniref:Probable beta-glucosidase G n=1 Tax=Kwoniella heveanensis BCC8398 TaxID=1296120 RepID=A0A1B9GJE5_9TREE|nr:avenacinase [Kwoniella heveanensis BCC8398]
MHIASLLVPAIALASLASGQYVVPAADGSDGWADALGKAKALVAQMTQEEKLNITQQNNDFPRVGEIDRLGYTGLFYADGAEGIRGASYSSAFPQALNGAATWDRNLLYRRAVAIGQEARAKGINVQFGPGVNLMRTPNAGRGFEYNGADPYLAGQAGAQHVQGVQSQGVMSTVRHYIGNDQETGRRWTSSNMGDRTAHELYLWPFQDAVKAGVASTMCSYNGLNGTYSCADPMSLGKWLHEELKFQGWVLSDFGAITFGEEIDAANAGVDTTRVADPPSAPFPFGPGSALSAAVANNSVSQDRLDDMVHRIVSAWYKLGQDQDYPAYNTSVNSLSKEHNELIREIGAKSIVLLKNSNSVDLLGAPFGGGAGAGPGGFGPDSDQGNFLGGSGSSYVIPPYQVTLLDALNQQAREQNTQVFAYLDNFNHTVQASQASTGNLAWATCLVDVRQTCGEGYDRANLTASWGGDQTILSVASQCANTVVIYSACGPFNTTTWGDHPNVTAILNAGGLGQEAGNSLVDVLYGVVNPSARLPYTLAQDISDYPALPDLTIETLNTSFVDIDYNEGLFIDYRWFDKNDIAPAFEFGFAGLSYTTYKYSNLSVQPSTATLQKTVAASSDEVFDCLAIITVDITNSGQIGGSEIPQLYIGSPADGAPIKVLRGFDTVGLDAGAKKTVEFQLTRRDLSFWDTYNEGWTLPEGDHQVYIGASSRDIRETGKMKFTLA